jgi:hypothetical protein
MFLQNVIVIKNATMTVLPFDSEDPQVDEFISHKELGLRIEGPSQILLNVQPAQN